MNDAILMDRAMGMGTSKKTNSKFQISMKSDPGTKIQDPESIHSENPRSGPVKCIFHGMTDLWKRTSPSSNLMIVILFTGSPESMKSVVPVTPS
jgi:hypothetical protein